MSRDRVCLASAPYAARHLYSSTGQIESSGKQEKLFTRLVSLKRCVSGINESAVEISKYSMARLSVLQSAMLQIGQVGYIARYLIKSMAGEIIEQVGETRGCKNDSGAGKAALASNLPRRPNEVTSVTVRMTLKVVLMLRLSLPEWACWRNLRDYLARPDA